MSEHIETLKDDIAFMRSLAEEGRRAPLLGGALLLAAGLIFSTATLATWAIGAGLIDLPGFSQSAKSRSLASVDAWFVATASFYVVFAVVAQRWRRQGKSGALTATNRTFRWAWAAGGCAMTVISFGTVFTALRLHSWLVFAAFPTIVLSLYGAAWMISTVLSDRWWVRWVAAGCFLTAVGLPLAPNAEVESLAFAAALLLLMAAPGAALMREEPSGVV